MKRFIFFFAAMAALFSCVKETPVADTPVVDTPVLETPAEEIFCVELKATAPSDGDDAVATHSNTKTTLVGGVDAEGNPKKFVHWSKGDAIKVLFFPNTISLNASFDAPSGVFVSNFSQESAKSAGFRCDAWSWGSTVNEQGISNSLQPDGIAIYPATATATSSKPKNMYVKANTEVSFILPSNQNAVKDNIESNLNFSYATVKLSEFSTGTSLHFDNACAMIELTMPSSLDKKVTSISLISNTSVPLTGKGTVKLTGYNNIIASPFGVDVTEGNGVVLNNANGFEAGETYYAVVWPGEHNSGLTIEFTAEDGSIATKTTGKVTLAASKVKPYTFNKGLEFIAPVQEFNYIYADGTTGNDVNSNIVGVVIFRGNPKEKFNDPDLPDQYCNGLAISVKTYSTKWHTSQPSTSNGNIKISSNTNLPSYNKGGYTVKNIWASEGVSLNIYNASNYDALNGNTSGWYHGTPLEWNYICENLSEINALLSQVPGAVQIAPSNNAEYALPLYYYSTKNWTFYINGGALIYKAYAYNFTSYAQTVRPIFAF